MSENIICNGLTISIPPCMNSGEGLKQFNKIVQSHVELSGTLHLINANRGTVFFGLSTAIHVDTEREALISATFALGMRPLLNQLKLKIPEGDSLPELTLSLQTQQMTQQPESD